MAVLEMVLDVSLDLQLLACTSLILLCTSLRTERKQLPLLQACRQVKITPKFTFILIFALTVSVGMLHLLSVFTGQCALAAL